MECGVPFCQNGGMLAGMASGCPLHNLVPETNDLVYTGNWKQAFLRLNKTHSFPEFTSRVCPALCEAACTCNLNGDPVSTKENEKAIIETAYAEGWVKPQIPPVRTGKTIAVIGSGPSGLAAAQQLNRRGHSVTVFERNDRIGGLLRYGIPNMKLEKKVIDRRLKLMEEEGVKFVTNINVGVDITAEQLLKDYDRVLLCCGASHPRDIKVPGRDAKGIYFAVDFLKQVTKSLLDTDFAKFPYELAKGKHVLVIGGGDTGSDCVGTANRQGAVSVTQIEIMPKPPVRHNPATPWPMYPMVLKTSSSHEEGCIRRWNLASNRFIGEKNTLKGVEVEEVAWLPDPNGGRPQMQLTGKKEVIEADLVFLAMGFVHPAQEGLIQELQLAIDGRKNIAVDGTQSTSAAGIFACGDATTGASLVVKAMASGRKTAYVIDKYLSRNS